MDLEKQAIDIMRTFASDDPYQLGYSGGKDSDVILHLAKKSGVKFNAIHNLTTVDAPETVYYVKKKKEVSVLYPKYSMWELIVKYRSPPTRLFRFCCRDLKEFSGSGKKLITGVRKFESRNRMENQGIVVFPNPEEKIKTKVDGSILVENKKKGVVIFNYDNSESRRAVENCYRTSKVLVNPILEWDDEYLWWYIRHEQIEINPLYNNGYPGGCRRIGCIGCPMSGTNRYKQFAEYPIYKRAYIRAFDKMLEARRKHGNKEIPGWKNGQGVFDWWMEDTNIEGQLIMDFDGEELAGYKEKGI